MGLIRKVGVLLAWLLLIVSTAVVTAAVKQRSEDGPNRVFPVVPWSRESFIRVVSPIGAS